MKTKRTIVTSLVVATVAASAAFSQGIGNVGSLPNSFGPTILPSGSPGWYVGQYPIVRDPNGSPWLKVFRHGPLQIVPNQVLDIHESFIISGTLPWADWHEHVITANWIWTPQVSLYANGNPAPGLVTNWTPSTLDLYFNSLPVGTIVDIHKQIQWLGPGIAGDVDVIEYPTPEPASLGLLGIGSLLALRRRRR